MKKKNPLSLIQRLINNQISKEEFDELLQGMDDEKTKERFENDLKDHFDEILEKHKNDSEYISTELEPAPISNRKEKTQPNFSSGNLFKKNTYFKIAATVILLAISMAALWILFLQQPNNDTITNNPTQVENPTLIEKITPRGTTNTYTLDDGSIAHLNADSKIIHPEKFELEIREVHLTGQAYFDVKPDETRPFLINAKDLLVEVVGTSFDIKAYENESKTSITVESGKVKVHSDKINGAPVELVKNQQLIYDKRDSSFTISEVDSSDEMSWRYGILRFNKTPVAEVEGMVERWYNVEINIEDTAIYQQKITGVHKNESLISVLKTLHYALDVNYKVEKNIVTLKKKK
jgi:ferric-dicitrate binding protein FerR (iron transport regulator)